MERVERIDPLCDKDLDFLNDLFKKRWKTVYTLRLEADRNDVLVMYHLMRDDYDDTDTDVDEEEIDHQESEYERQRRERLKEFEEKYPPNTDNEYPSF